MPRKSMPRDALYLEQMLSAIAKIESFTVGITADAFETDQKTQSAVILQLLLIGELAKKVSEETRAAIALPWKEIAGFRDRAVHDYFDIDLDIVWNTVQTDIPELKKQLGHVEPKVS